MKAENVTLEEFKSSAYDAYRWTSFDPGMRAESTLSDHEAQLNRDLESIPEDEQERYIINYKKYFSAWLSARSRCASSAITGGSGFDSSRAEKANRIEHNKYGDFSDWRERTLKAIRSKAKKEENPEQSHGEQLASFRKSINSSCKTIYEINTGINNYSSKALIVSNLYNKIETYMKKGDIEMVELAVDRIRKWNETTPIVSEKHKIFRLSEMAANVHANKIAKQSRENKEFKIIGGKIVYNYAYNRLQIVFDEKPDKTIINSLKHKSFKWAPSIGVWQRQLTSNATYDVKQLLEDGVIKLVK